MERAEVDRCLADYVEDCELVAWRRATREAEYRVIAVDGEVAVAVGSTTCSVEPGGPAGLAFDNCFVLAFDAAGRCGEFTEWYVERPRRA
jgi:hypothetical protein